MTTKNRPSTRHRTILDACDQVIANERFAHHLAKASVERWFAFELAAVLDDVPGRVALVECGGKRGALGNIDLLLVERSQVRHGLRLAPPQTPWDGSAIAIEIKAAHLRDGRTGYKNALVTDLLEKPELARHKERPCQEWLGLLITTDGGWGAKVPDGDFTQRQALMREERLELAPSLKSIGRVKRENLRYREWAGSAWVELVTPAPVQAPA